MPRNTSLPIITGREKGVKMRGFKPFLVELKKKKKKWRSNPMQKLQKHLKKKSAPKKKVVGIMKHNQVF